MTTELTFASFATQLRESISSHSALPTRHSALKPSFVAPTGTTFGDLALALFRLQFQHNTTYRRLCESRKVTPEHITDWRDIPAVPASAFKEQELTSLAPEDRSYVFFSSGTTGQQHSRHFHSSESFSIYEASLLPWFEQHLLADVNDLVDEQLLGPHDKLPMLALTPLPQAAPNSSLVHMFDTVRREFGSRDSQFAGRVDASNSWSLDIDATLFAIRKSMCANRPLMLLGTAFNFVHLLDHFTANKMRYRLAQGSRVLETGGYKGQSRAVPREELHGLLTKHLGIAPEYIVTEYGMSELSSQAYDSVAGRSRVGCPQPAANVASQSRRSEDTAPYHRVFRFPLWARAQVTCPETGREVADGETGLLRVFDLANVRSVMAIQTDDLAVRCGEGFALLGRAVQSAPRGCSLMSSNAEAPR